MFVVAELAHLITASRKHLTQRHDARALRFESKKAIPIHTYSYPKD